MQVTQTASRQLHAKDHMVRRPAGTEASSMHEADTHARFILKHFAALCKLRVVALKGHDVSLRLASSSLLHLAIGSMPLTPQRLVADIRCY